MGAFRALACAVAACLLMLNGVIAASAERRVALVIGNGAYKNASALPNPVNDATDVAAALKRVGFETVVGLDLDRSGMEDAAIRFARMAREADVAMFFYAGHAMQHAGVNYLMPVDARLADEADLRRMARVDEIVADLQQARNLRILVLDACRDNPLAEAFKRSVGATRAAAVPRGLARLDSPQGMIVAYATQAGRTADDGKGRNSPYTAALLKHIEAPAEIGTVFRRISGDVYEATGRQQLPELSLSVIGEFYLRGRPDAAVAAPAPAAPAFDPRAVELAYWESARNATSPEIVRSYLERYPQGTFALLARARLQELEQKARIAALPPSPSPPAQAAVAPVPAPPAAVVPAPAPPPPVAALPPPASRPQTAPAAGPGQTISIGVAGPLTGGSAAFGQQIRTGAEQAVADINAAGGILGKRLALDIADDRCDPKEARAVAERLAGRKVPLVVGHFCSSSSIPASEVYAQADVLQITPASTNPAFTERRLWNAFRVTGRDDQQVVVAARHIVRNFKGRNVAILHNRTSYGNGLADGIKKALNGAGMREKLFDPFNRDDKDFSALVAKLRRDAIDVVFVGGFQEETGLIVRQMRTAGLKATVFAGDAIADQEFAVTAGPSAEGVLFAFGPDPRRKPSAAAVVQAFRTRNVEPEGYVLYSYAALQVWAQAVRKAGTTDPKTVATALKAGQWDTVLGRFGFDAKGDITVIDYVVYRWDRSGTYAEIASGGR
jgi:branched-chain amino acid transport system substrate-binding protein